MYQVVPFLDLLVGDFESFHLLVVLRLRQQQTVPEMLGYDVARNFVKLHFMSMPFIAWKEPETPD
jgi:hypothetical protein